MIGLDLGNMLVNLWSAWKRDREFQAWVKLVMSTIYSGVIAFLGTDGAALLYGVFWLKAMGGGMLAAAVAITSVLLRAPQGRSITLSLPGDVVKAVQDAKGNGQVTIEPTK